MGFLHYLFFTLNTMVFIEMLVDKIQAKRLGSRIPESILLLSGLFGGVGIVLASFLCNHKHGKVKFRLIMSLELVLNIFLAIKFL